MVCEDGQQTLGFHHCSQFLFVQWDMGHSSASGFSHSESLIKNALDGNQIHREISYPYSSSREGKLLQKALKSRAYRNQTFSTPFFVAAGKFAGFESPESIFDSGQ
jgi:hypothetical protein